MEGTKVNTGMKVSRNSPERRSGKKIGSGKSRSSFKILPNYKDDTPVQR